MFEMILNSPMVSFMVIFVITVFSALTITFLYIILRTLHIMDSRKGKMREVKMKDKISEVAVTIK